jgi:DNA sulfur modification protein DndE
MIETVKVSDKARQQLINIKKRTGIQNWNVICRWAFTTSLAEKSKVLDENIIANSPVEMTWKTFSGGHEKLYMALLLTKAKKDNWPTDEEGIQTYFKLHLHRGISYLNGKSAESIQDLLKNILSENIH